MRLRCSRSDGVTIIALATVEHRCELLVDLMYVVTVLFLSAIRLHNQEVSFNHVEEVMDEPRTIRVGMQFPDELRQGQ